MLEGGLAILRLLSRSLTRRATESSRIIIAGQRIDPFPFSPAEFYRRLTRVNRVTSSSRRTLRSSHDQRASIECRKSRSKSLRCDLIKRDANVSDTFRAER